MIKRIDLCIRIIYGKAMKHLNPIIEMTNAIPNANKSNARAMSMAVKLYNPDTYMDSKRDCHKIFQRGLEALEKHGHNSTRH